MEDGATVTAELPVAGISWSGMGKDKVRCLIRSVILFIMLPLTELVCFVRYQRIVFGSGTCHNSSTELSFSFDAEGYMHGRWERYP